ncbi:hypothetical protein [Deinococcus sp. JMULE3]|uniref:hypothetical protein n=1 Tax=Deinococcus sp. JMULE3 TaxID=2518341 RepID=UPI001576B10B|nr:hypothetical protein [Deinococcus sp. JMULE3]NTY00416.1 hypothetical protein [Deinococcus sp. JMULE3]
MLDNILSTVKKGAERVQRRGEEVASATRLRVEIFSLGRELDGLFARLGRSYHAGADLDVLNGVREDIRRVEEEIRARERLITELGEQDDPDAAPAATDLTPVTNPSPSNQPNFTTPPQATRTEPTVPASVPHPTQTPEVHMSDDTRTPTTPDPTVQHSDEKIVPGDATASMGNEAARDGMARHDNMIEEGKAASRNPDPLEK